jgi:4'-phosphopantetheinyl transferase
VLLTCDTRPGGEDWSARPDFRSLSGIALFRLPVAASHSFARQATALLQAQELQRAHRYHRPADYYRFLLGRAAQRLVLGAYLGLPPAALHFEPGANKKPQLREAPLLHYNISHAGDLVLLAVSKTEVGVDVEQLNALFTFQELLDYSFSPAEKAFIEASPIPHCAFYQFWTRKEAFVKATGQGIDAEFHQVPALDGKHCLAAAGPVTAWTVSSLQVGTGYIAALARPTALVAAPAFYDLSSVTLSELYAAALG